MKLLQHKYFYLNAAIVLIVLSALLRFWKVPQLFFFGIDEEYQAFLAESIVKDFHLIWIGLSSGSTGFYVGPGFTYFNALLFWLSKGDPVILGYTASLIGVANTAALLFITKEFFGKKAAVITTILYTFSAFTNLYDRRFWNSTFVPLAASLLYYSYIQASKNKYWLLVIAFLLGAILHIHATLFVFFPLSIFLLISIFKKHKQIDWKIIAASVLIFVVTISPLIVYDLVHNFDNIRTPIRMLLKSNNGGAPSLQLINHAEVIFSTLTKSLYIGVLPFWLFITVSLIFIISFCWFIWKMRGLREKILLAIIAVYTLFLLFFPGVILEYYLLGAIPFWFILFGLILVRLKPVLTTIIISVFLVVNLYSVFSFSDDAGLQSKKQLIQLTATAIGNKTFRLEITNQYLYDGGWRYLFSIYGKKPITSDADEMFGWIYPTEIKEDKADLLVIVSSKNTPLKKKPFKIYTNDTHQTEIYHYEE